MNASERTHPPNRTNRHAIPPLFLSSFVIIGIHENNQLMNHSSKMNKHHQGLSPALIALMSIATGLSVASNYYAQPLLDAIARAFALSQIRLALLSPQPNSAMPQACCSWCPWAICLSAGGSSSP
jgi:hypothetical protein